MHLPADDLAAVDTENRIQIKPASCVFSGQVRRIPSPEVNRSVRDMGRCWAFLFGLFGATTVSALTLSAQHPTKGRFTGDVNSLNGQGRDDACRGPISKARLIGYAPNPRALLGPARIRRRLAYVHRPAIAGLKSLYIGFPSVQRSFVNPAHPTGFAQPSARALRSTDILDQKFGDLPERSFVLAPMVSI